MLPLHQSLSPLQRQPPLLPVLRAVLQLQHPCLHTVPLLLPLPLHVQLPPLTLLSLLLLCLQI
jgi:hypothetical protein